MHSKEIVMNNTTYTVLPPPTKSPNDKKSYKVIRLANGLTACLISDPSHVNKDDESDDESTDSESDLEVSTSDETEEGSSTENSQSEVDEEESDSKHFKIPEEEQKMAATGLCIGVGSFSDIKEIPGLAHFLEHMVFMGSEKYPQENDFDSFIKKRGGFDNAATDAETTVFYFECLEKHLFKALDKFAQFFIAPLMKRTSIAREREAVESEFQMSVPSDTARKDQIICGLFNPEVPINKFSWGNLKTLRDDVTEDYLYEKLHEFRKRHYSAHRMTLAIQARLPMDALEDYVTKCFADVPTNDLPPDNFEIYEGKIFKRETFAKLYHIDPMKEKLQVDLIWALPSLLKKYKSKPEEYVSWILGHEGKGSLLSYLKEKMWAMAIYTGNDGSGADHNSMFSMFEVNLVLTKDGYDHLCDVIKAVFSYMKLIRPDERIFDEMKLIADTAFRFADEEDAGEFVEEICESMYFYPSEDYLTGSELHFEFNPKDIQDVLSRMTPENMLITVFVSDESYNLVYDQVEPWFGTKYSVKDVPNEWIDSWEKVGAYPEFSLPQPNQFLTTNFDLLPAKGDVPEYPIKIFNTDVLELWYRKDQKFNLPIAYYYLHLIRPYTNKDCALNECMNQMFMFLLNFQLIEEIYPATIAELSYKLHVSGKGFVIKVNGFNEKLPILIALIGKYFISVADKLTEKMFDAIKDKMIKYFHNNFLKPDKFAKELRMSLLLEQFSSSVDKYSVIETITYDMMKKYCETVSEKLYVQALVQGNVDEVTATKTVQSFVDTLKCGKLDKAEQRKYRVYQLPKGTNYCKIKSFNTEDANSIITNYYQSRPYDMKETVIIELLMMIIEEPLFDTLRTKEQLGYDVHCIPHDTYGIMGYSITVNTQIVKNSVAHVDARIEAFVRSAAKMLRQLSEKKFNQIKSDLIKIKQCVDVHLKDETERNWNEVIKEEYFFDRMKQEIKAIETVKLGDVRSWWNDHNMCGNENNNCRKLCIQVEGHECREDSPEAVNGTIIDKPAKKTADVLQKSYKLELTDNGKDTANCYIKSLGHFQRNLTLHAEHKAVPGQK